MNTPPNTGDAELDNEHDDPIYSKPMTPEQRFRQEILMYVRDKILGEVMAPVRKNVNGIHMVQRDHTLIDKLVPRYTDGLIKLIATHDRTLIKAILAEDVPEKKNRPRRLLATGPRTTDVIAYADDFDAAIDQITTALHKRLEKK